jgi:hypothetical protein
VYIVEGRVIIAQMGIQTGQSDEAMAPGLFLFQGFVNVQGLLLVTDGVVELEFCVFFAVGDKFIDFAQFGYDQGAVNVGEQGLAENIGIIGLFFPKLEELEVVVALSERGEAFKQRILLDIFFGDIFSESCEVEHKKTTQTEKYVFFKKHQDNK